MCFDVVVLEPLLYEDSNIDARRAQEHYRRPSDTGTGAVLAPVLSLEASPGLKLVHLCRVSFVTNDPVLITRSIPLDDPNSELNACHKSTTHAYYCRHFFADLRSAFRPQYDHFWHDWVVF